MLTFARLSAIPEFAAYDDPPAGDPPAGDPPAGDPPAGDKTFSQADLDRIVQDRLARDRKAREESYKDLEGKYQELLGNQNLSQEERDKLQTKLDDVQKQLRTKDQQLLHEKKTLQTQFEQELTGWREKATAWESRFRESSIQRELRDAAVTHDAYNSSQIEALLRPMAQLKPVTDEMTGKETDRFQTMIDFPDQNEKGEPIITQHTPESAVKRMKELSQYANLFKANIVAGVGANNATGGLTPGSNGKIDVTKLTMEQYAKIRKENPELLGLKR